jgi:hypothetical protein
VSPRAARRAPRAARREDQRFERPRQARAVVLAGRAHRLTERQRLIPLATRGVDSGSLGEQVPLPCAVAPLSRLWRIPSDQPELGKVEVGAQGLVNDVGLERDSEAKGLQRLRLDQPAVVLKRVRPRYHRVRDHRSQAAWVGDAQRQVGFVACAHVVAGQAA